MAELTTRLNHCEAYCRIEHKNKQDKDKKMENITIHGGPVQLLEPPQLVTEPSPR
jgi:hypothetical protein